MIIPPSGSHNEWRLEEQVVQGMVVFDADIIRCRIDLASSSTVLFRPDLFFALISYGYAVHAIKCQIERIVKKSRG